MILLIFAWEMNIMIPSKRILYRLFRALRLCFRIWPLDRMETVDEKGVIRIEKEHTA